MKRIIVAAGIAAAFAATPASAQELPPVQCDPVSCTDRIDRTTEGAKECLDNARAAIREVLEGTPQPQTCDL